eukprot:670753-Pleurochrysis_carterae.AAC.1
MFIVLDLELVHRAKTLDDIDAGGRGGRKARRGEPEGKSKKKVSEEEEMANYQAEINNAAGLVHVARSKLCTWFVHQLGRFDHAQSAASSWPLGLAGVHGCSCMSWRRSRKSFGG